MKPAVLVICALAIFAYFLALAGPGLRAGFTTDDLVNLTKYWDQSLTGLVKASVLYFSPAYRPMGALFYRPLFALAGFSPLPYHVLCFVLLIGNLGLIWLAIRSITRSPEIAVLSANNGRHQYVMVWCGNALHLIKPAEPADPLCPGSQT